jgi:hypothetical protein
VVKLELADAERSVLALRAFSAICAMAPVGHACPGNSGLEGAEGLQRLAQPGSYRPGDLSLRLVLVVGLDELLVLLLDLLRVLARRADVRLLGGARIQVGPRLVSWGGYAGPRPGS